MAQRHKTVMSMRHLVKLYTDRSHAMHRFHFASSSLLVVSIALLASACATRSATYAPDGRRGYVITCGGFLNSYSSCLVKAGRACGNKGYDILKGAEDDRDMLIACKTSVH
jgi:hypothetical protein